MQQKRALTAFCRVMLFSIGALTSWVAPKILYGSLVFIGANFCFQPELYRFLPSTIVLRKVFGFKTEKETSQQKK